MKNFFKKLRKEKNEKGSGIVLVIVALSFLGIIAGALLTAVAYAYRLKLYDYNNKDNFHFVEQAMDEVYAGLGGRTTSTMQDAYTRTVEEMVEFDVSQRAYKNIGDAEANKRFKDYFMNGIKTDIAFTNISTLTELLQSYISNSSVEVVSDNMKVLYYDVDGNVVMTVPGSTMLDSISSVEIGKIVIKNVVLRRTAEYERSSANGTFTQTISTDIEIARPDFNVQFNTVNVQNSVLYDYSLIADSGVEINKSAASPLLINGNIYAAADFYNKTYNQYGVTDTDYLNNYRAYRTISSATNNDGSVSDIVVGFDSVSSKKYIITDNSTGAVDHQLYNARLADMLYGNANGILDASEVRDNFKNKTEIVYNGYNENSKYSGLYINGAKVSIMADTMVVPGTIAVMNGANLSVYNSNGTNIGKTNVWADNVVLGGYSVANTTGGSFGSKAMFVANMFVRDDLEINADNANFELIGAYYGYGNGTQTKRRFIPVVSVDGNGINIYQYGTQPGDAEDRSHYNSSAIVVNGQLATVDLSQTKTLYVAGQAYLELSAKHQDIQVSNDQAETVYASGDPSKVEVTKETITYDATKNDYRTGESVSVKSNQLIYIPNGTGTYDDVKDSSGNVIYQTIAINSMLLTPDSSGKNLFKSFFKDTDKVPCVSIKPAGSTRTYHYFDFERAFEEDNKGFDSADEMAAAYAEAYMAELNKSTSSLSADFSPIKEYLDADVTSGDLFSAGEIILPETVISGSSTSQPEIYASGALTNIVKSSTGKNDFSIVVNKDSGITRPVTADGDVSEFSTGTTTGDIDLARDFAKHYNYVKFALVDLAAGSSEADFVDDVVADALYGESSLTPLNRFFKMNNLWDVSPATSETEDGSTEHVLKLSSGYKIWISNGDVKISQEDCELIDGQYVVRGIVISKGDVYLGSDETTGINRFEGLIVAGDKIFVGNSVNQISANPQVCKAIMTELQTEKDVDAEKVLRTFIGYKSAYDEKTIEELRVLCDNREISYSESDTKEVLITLLIAYDNNGDNTVKPIDTIDYSDVVRYSNWMKNSE